MKRAISLILGIVLLASVNVSSVSAYFPWRYVNSYIYSNSSIGNWQVVTWYHVRMNGLYVQETAPMDCEVTYAIGQSLNITYCNLDRLSWYSPDRWRVTTRWTDCFWWFCASHGHSITFKANGYVTERRHW